MNFLILLFQVGDLFEGKFNWAGVFVLLIFSVMAFIIVGLGVFLGYKAFTQKSRRDE